MSNVYANRVLSGSLERVNEFSRFAYAKTAGISECVSLLMPLGASRDFTTDEPGVVHPVFAMNLPEGRLRESLLQTFAKALPGMDDMALLEIVGRSQIGRLRIAATTVDLDAVPALSLNSLLATQGTGRMLDELLQRYARYSGVAGVQPKVLVRDEDAAPLKNSLNKISVSGATHIVKFFESDKFPALAANEYACLQAAKNAGLPVPAIIMSDDAQCLAIERFDINDDGTYKAVEDTCALANRQPREKYTGTYEQVAKTLGSVIAPAHIRRDMGIFFRSLVLSVVVRNGDAHRKNFSVVYDTPSQVRLSPVYDIISSTPYIKSDTLALLLDGSKRWPAPTKLLRFAINSCHMEPNEAREAIEQVCAAVAQTRGTLKDLREAAGDAQARAILEYMEKEWETGLRQTMPRPPP